jgi:hypothetical protein
MFAIPDQAAGLAGDVALADGMDGRDGGYCLMSNRSFPPLTFSARAAACSGMRSGQRQTACRLMPSALAALAWLPKNSMTFDLFIIRYVKQCYQQSQAVINFSQTMKIMLDNLD